MPTFPDPPEAAPVDVRDVTDAAELWRAWVDDEPVDEAAVAAEESRLTARLQRHDVTAVIVAHDGARWLRFCLAALADLDRPPRRVVAVDTGSTDSSAAVLAEAIGEASVLRMPRDTGFGAAVAHAVDALEGAPGLPTAHDDAPAVAWLWLLHDDCAPEPGALRALLLEAERTPSAGVIGPKVRGWKDGRLLLELGVSLGRGGRRETDLERGETDQGQHDQRRDVLSVGSAGMLVRRDVWDALGGFAADLPMFRDDVDFGWRALRAGYRVVVAPEAVVHHAEAAAHGRREPVAAGVDVHRADRRSALLVLLGNLPGRALPWAYVRLTLGSLVRALGLLLGKAPRAAAEELAAWGAVVARPDRVVAARRRRAAPRTEPWSSVRPLLAPSGTHLRHGLEAAFGSAGAGVSSGAGSALESGPVGDEADAMAPAGDGVLAKAVRRPGVWVVLGLLLVTVLAWRGLLVGGALQGGALLPAPGSAGDLWTRFSEPWHAVGVGSDLAAPPWIAAVALPSVLALGRPGLLVGLLLVLAVPLAGASAYVALRRLTSSRGLRLWGAATYALLPAVTGAVAAGRLGTAVVAGLLPWLVLATWRLRPQEGSVPTWRSVCGTGLLASVAAAFVPVVWAAAAVGLAVAGILVRPARAWWLRGAAFLLVPVAVLLPWSFGLVAHPSRILLEAGAQGRGLSDADLPAWAVALAWPGGPGLAAPWVTAGLLAAGLAGLVVGRRRRVAAAAWGVALVGLGLGLLTLVVRVPVSSLDASVVPWPGTATLLVGGGLVAAAVVGAEGVQTALARQAFGWRQPVAVVIVTLALLAPAAAAVSWVARGAGGPLTRLDTDVLPAFVAASAATPQQPSTLTLTSTDGSPVAYALLHRSGGTLGDADVAPAVATAGPLGALVSDLASGRAGDDIAARLATYGAGYVLVTAPADPSLTQALDAVPGLERLAATDGSALWGVAGDPARLRAQASDGSAVALPSGPVDAAATLPPAVPDADGVLPTRVLALANAADPNWRATLDGNSLVPLGVDQPPAEDPPVPAYSGPTAQWAQRFALPAGGGQVSLSYDGTARTRWLLLETLVVLGIAVVALPGRRPSEVDDEDDDLQAPPGGAPGAEPLNRMEAAR
ncbi:MAG TPA: glycosyltransferase family 2 protein [Candidatus Limnocylindria bacterium]|nr:glycosyltransferase family 2 protein [Candidatus Limnocylindria bacterium]